MVSDGYTKIKSNKQAKCLVVTGTKATESASTAVSDAPRGRSSGVLLCYITSL